jgi:ribosomal-protein-alanine N-acetyltransferase
MRAPDLAAVAAVQAASPETSQWPVEDYLSYQSLVAVAQEHILGFMVWRDLGGSQAEILNLAVDPAERRRGLARMLVESMLTNHPGEVFLEVRESNIQAQVFYLTLGFQKIGSRPGYYDNPAEPAIVMVFHSC